MCLFRLGGLSLYLVGALGSGIASCSAGESGSTGKGAGNVPGGGGIVDPTGVVPSTPTSGGAATTPAPDNNDAPPDDCKVVLNGDVTISAPSGTFLGSVSVTLATAIAGAEIRYTTDGQPPTAASTLYPGVAIPIAATTRLRAQAFVQGAAAGAPSAALYVARGFDATHDLPVIVLDSYGSGALPEEESQRVPVDVAYLQYDVVGSGATLSALPSTVSYATFHVRGQSSTMFPKVPYRLTLRNDAGNKRDCPVLGMPNESDWALIGPYADKTLVHNVFVYNLGREIGIQAPRIRLAELYINLGTPLLSTPPLSSGDYQGVYQVVEIIKNQKDRTNLKQLDSTVTTRPEISGGYIFKFEWKASEPPLLACPSGTANCWKDLEIVDPDPINQQQTDYLTQYLKQFNDAIHTSGIADLAAGYPAYIDTRSFIDNVIVNEFTRNMDAFSRSQYFYKDRDAKVFAGPLWDFDLIAGSGISAGAMSMGGGSSFANTDTAGWQYESNKSRLAGATSDWFPVLIAEPNFRAQLVQRWQELRLGPLSDAGIAARIDTAAAGLANAADRNFKKWNILTQATVTPFTTPTESTWAGQVAYMKSWLQKRAAWIDTQWR